jgi:hypothetical protein
MLWANIEDVNQHCYDQETPIRRSGMLEIKNRHGIIRLEEWGRCMCFLERERRKTYTP